MAKEELSLEHVEYIGLLATKSFAACQSAINDPFHRTRVSCDSFTVRILSQRIILYHITKLFSHVI